MIRYRFTLQASQDLEAIHEYVAMDNATAAKRLLSLFEAKCELLSRSPQIGRARAELARSLRSFPVGNYVIFYRPASQGVDIVRILHASRDIASAFSESS